MVTYKNKCELERVACNGGNKFGYAHKGECESKLNRNHVMLTKMSPENYIHCTASQEIFFMFVKEETKRWKFLSTVYYYD